MYRFEIFGNCDSAISRKFQRDYFVFHFVFVSFNGSRDIKIVPLYISSPIPMNIIVQRWQRFLEQLVVRAIINPRYTRADSFSKTQKSTTFFLLFSFLRIAFIPGSSIELSSIFSVVFYTDVFFHSNFYSLFRSRTVSILNQTRSPINRRSSEFVSHLMMDNIFQSLHLSREYDFIYRGVRTIRTTITIGGDIKNSYSIYSR